MSQVKPRKLTKKQLIGLVYVAISLVLVGWLVQMTQAQVQYFASVHNLQPDASNVQFIFDPHNGSNGSARVTASVNNPSDNGGIEVFTVQYTVFVAGFVCATCQGSTEVAISISTFSQKIPPGGSLNLTSIMSLMPDVVLPLQDFVNMHPNYVTLVQTVINLQSSYGTIQLPACFQQPSQPVAECPAPRSSSGGGGGGGG